MKTRNGQPYAGSLAIGILALAFGAGCSSEPYKYVQVSGDLKYEDGSVIKGEGLSLIFKPQVEPIDEKTHPKDGIAYLEEDGSFSSVTSHKYEDGIIEGTHHVLVIATGPDGKSLWDPVTVLPDPANNPRVPALAADSGPTENYFRFNLLHSLGYLNGSMGATSLASKPGVNDSDIRSGT